MDSELDQRTQNSLQHSSHHPSFSFTHSSVSQNNEHVASQECRDARLLACDADEEMSVMEEKVITGMCFGFLTNVSMQLTVHACDMITHLKLR